MKFILDTSAYSAFNRGDERLKPYIHASNNILVPVIVVGELRGGFAAGGKQAANETLLQRFLDAPAVSVAALSDRTTQIFANVYANLRKSGTPIGSNDIWIAAAALEHGLPILSLDSDFRKVKKLSLIEV